MKFCILFLILFHLFYFFPFYFTENVICQRDLVFLTLPNKFEAVHQWRNGIIPFWDEKLSNGQPLLANPTSSSIYPFMFPLIISPNLKTFTFLCLFHHLLFVFGIFIFSNLILKNPFLSLFLSTFLGYNGIVIEFFSFCNPLWGIMYLPWSLFFFYKYLKNDKKLHLILCSLSFAFSILAGFDLAPFLFSFSLIILTIYVNYKKIQKLLLCFLLAFLFSAPQTIPSLLYLPHTSRAEKQKFYEHSFGFYSLHPLRAQEIFIPRFHGAKLQKGNGNFWADAISDKEAGLFISPYFGLFAILLLVSLRPFEKKWIFLIITLIFLIFSFGRYFPFHFYLLKIPIFSNIRFPEKFLVFLLIFFYFSFLFNLKKYLRISILPSFLLILIISSILLINELTSGTFFKKYISYTTFQEITDQTYLMKKYLFITLLLISAYFLIFYISKKVNFLHILFPIICFLDLFYGCHHRIIPYQEDTIKSPLTKILKEQNSLRIMHIEESVEYNSANKNIGLFRIETLYPNSGILFGLSYGFASSVDSMEPKFLNKELKDINFKMWGISHIILSGRKAPENEDFIRYKGYDLLRIDRDPTFIWFLNEKTKEAEPIPNIKIKNPSKFKIKLKNYSKGILWVGYTLLPGWNVYVNGEKRNMANPEAEGLNVELESGENTIEFKYTPPGFYLGLCLFSTGIFLCVIIFLWKRRN